MPHAMRYSHFGNGVRNGAISIMQLGFISGCYKWGKILVMAMEFVNHLGQCLIDDNTIRAELTLYFCTFLNQVKVE